MTDFQTALTNWLDYLQTQRGRSPSTLAEYRRDLQTFHRHLVGPSPDHIPVLQTDHGPVERLADVTNAHLASYLVHLKHQHQLANSTLSRKISSLKSLFSYAARTYLIPTDPAADLDLPTIESRIPEDLSEPQVAHLLAQVQGDDWLTVRNRAILQTFLNTGLRVAELTDLDRAHIDLERDQVRVIGKGNKERIIPLNRSAKVALLDWLDRRDDLGMPNTDAVFITRRSRKRISPRAVQMMVAKYTAAAELKDVTPHTLRHTFGTRLHARGVSLREIQDLMGHKSPLTTTLYTHTNHKQRRAAVHLLAPTPTDLLEEIR